MFTNRSGSISLVAACLLVPTLALAEGGDSNPRIIKAKDAKLNKEFECLVYDLGKGTQLKLVKITSMVGFGSPG